MVTTSYMWLFKHTLIIIKQDLKKSNSLVAQAPFHILSGHIQLVATTVDNAVTEHFHHLRKFWQHLFCRLLCYLLLERRYKQQLENLTLRSLLFILGKCESWSIKWELKRWVQDQYLIKLPHKKIVKISAYPLKSNHQGNVWNCTTSIKTSLQWVLGVWWQSQSAN